MVYMHRSFFSRQYCTLHAEQKTRTPLTYINRPAGETGPTGPTGPIGPTGATGPTGSVGCVYMCSIYVLSHIDLSDKSPPLENSHTSAKDCVNLALLE